MNTHTYKHTYTHTISMSTSKILSRFDLKIYKVDHQKYLIVDGTSPFTKRIINHKYNNHIKYMI
jgi:hypothetical protein